ncbi:hypothetical protein ACH5RR_026603 [Cinchona calisaya]|uniref:Reverse transcriptase n=1 Tax=Cinchona calisaya TaxID=153742 RepID=A0ABD2Z375_9GENT
MIRGSIWKKIITKHVTTVQVQVLKVEITEMEIKQAICSMKDGKAPRPDGFSIEFYKQNWKIIGLEFISAIKYCFEQEYMYKPVNSLIITLVLKEANPFTISKFKPISCCNVLYKMLFKGANREIEESLTQPC